VTLVAFVGPSISREETESFGAIALGPARQGDVWRALERKPAAIALIDGLFETAPSVWHRELLSAIDEGVAVFGASSMGALRAAELDRHGMVGVGTVHRWVKEGIVRDDAEVALLHADAESAFRPLTVPLVQVRAVALAAVERRLLSSSEARALVFAAERIHYQDRRWPSVFASLRWPAEARERFAQFVPTVADVKLEDARECLRLAGEYASVAPPAAPRASIATSWERRARLDRGQVEKLANRPDAGALELLGAQSIVAESFARAFGVEPAAAFTHAQRLVPDGPSPDECLLRGARLRGRR
jgi:hypothetical protein